MKVSKGGCEKEAMHHKSLPWENRVECVCVSVPVRLLGEPMFYSQQPFCLSAFTSAGFDVDEDGRSAGR